VNCDLTLELVHGEAFLSDSSFNSERLPCERKGEAKKTGDVKRAHASFRNTRNADEYDEHVVRVSF